MCLIVKGKVNTQNMLGLVDGAKSEIQFQLLIQTFMPHTALFATPMVARKVANCITYCTGGLKQTPKLS